MRKGRRRSVRRSRGRNSLPEAFPVQRDPQTECPNRRFARRVFGFYTTSIQTCETLVTCHFSVIWVIRIVIPFTCQPNITWSTSRPTDSPQAA